MASLSSSLLNQAREAPTNYTLSDTAGREIVCMGAEVRDALVELADAADLVAIAFGKISTYQPVVVPQHESLEMLQAALERLRA